MITPIIETERLILRPLTVKDAPDIFERWCRDERVARYVTWSVHRSVEETKEWIAMEEKSLESDKAYQWGFTLKENGYLFGSGGFFYNEEEEAWELGYNLMFDFWNQGYATEAAKAMLDFGINELKEKEFMARHAVDNPASGAVMRKCGFQYEKNEMHTKFDGITTYGSNDLTKTLQECDDPVFLLTIGTTETSLIDGISGAGPSADLTEYTPASDVEFMVLGEVRCCEAPAETVVGDAAAPTPARLTKAALQLSNIPFVIVDAGSKIKPDLEYVSLGKEYGRDIRTGKGVLNPLEIFENAKDLGNELSQRHEMLIIGESIAAGTTTALGVLKALGYEANEKVIEKEKLKDSYKTFKSLLSKYD